MKICHAAVFSLLIAAVFSTAGCRPALIAVTDPVWERFAEADSGSRENPSWIKRLETRNYWVVPLNNPSDSGAWKGYLEQYSPEAVFWSPVFQREASEFASAYPEIRCLIPAPRVSDRNTPANLHILSVNRLKAYRELGLYTADLISGGTRTAAVFYTGSREREEEKRAFENGMNSVSSELYSEFSVRSSRDLNSAKDFLSGALKKGVRFVVLSAGGGNAELRRILTDSAVSLFIEEGEYSADSDPSVNIFFYTDWSRIFKEVLAVSPETWETEYQVEPVLAERRPE